MKFTEAQLESAFIELLEAGKGVSAKNGSVNFRTGAFL
jgi:hypothetical protein